MNTDVIKSYLVSLGYEVDAQSLNKFNDALRSTAAQVSKFTEGMTTAFVEAGAAVVTTLTAIAGGTVALMESTARADMGFALLARRMYMTKDAARSMKIATDALGYSIEDIVWGPAELRDRYRQLIQDQRALAAGLGGGSFEAEMKRIRDITFEFTRLKVEAQYFVMGLTKALSTALTGDENGILNRLRSWNEWLIANVPVLADKLSVYLAPVLRDVYRIWADMVAVGRDVTSVLISLLGELTDDAKLKSGKVNLENIGTALKFIADETRKAADAIREIIDDITALNKIKVPWWLTPSGPYQKLWGGGTSQGAFLGSPIGTPVGKLEGESPTSREDVKAAITAAARMYGIDPAVALAVAKKESGYNQSAVSPVGALGIMQLMPRTAAGLGVDPRDSGQNIRGGVNYLSQLFGKYGNWTQALEEYNWGHADQVRKGNVPASVQKYAADVIAQSGITINIYASTNASAEEIARHSAKAVDDHLNKVSQRMIVQAGAYGQYA